MGDLGMEDNIILKHVLYRVSMWIRFMWPLVKSIGRLL